MAVLYSDQITKARALADGSGYELVSGTDTTGGKERVAYFSKLSTGAAQNDTLELVTLPKGARILGGVLLNEALGASCTIALGTDLALAEGTSTGTAISAAVNNLLAATDVSAAAATPFAATFALGAGAVCANGNTKIIATIAGAAPTTARDIAGWVRYLQN